VSLIAEFITEALETQAKDDDDVLWCKVDPVVESMTSKLVANMLDVTIRDNLDGPGEVKTYRITIEELK
jgi:hypothetical protein